MNLVEGARKMTINEWFATWPQRLLLALWAIIAGAFLAVFVADLLLSYQLIATPCAGQDCHYQAITAVEAAALADWGLPVTAYALYMLGVSVLPVLFFTALAALMLGRLYPQREGIFYSLTLIVIPVVAITSFDVVADAFPRLTIPIQLIVVVGHLLLMSLFLVFPRSRFEPRWTAIIPVFSAFFGLYPLFFAESFSFSIAQPYFLLLILAVAVIFYRYRRLFNDSERLQTKWAILGILIFFVGVPIWAYTFEIAAPAPGQARLLTTLGGWTLCMIATMALPTAIFIAILRDRLWDIDLILNRTLVYGGLTALVTAVYILLVGGVSSLSVSEQSHLVVFLVATVMVLLGIRPLYHWLQARADKWLPPAKPASHAETNSKMTGLVLLRAAWGSYVLLALTLFVAGSVYQARIGFLQLPPEQVMASAPLLARAPFETYFFLENGLYPFVLAGAYIQAAAFVTVGLFLFWRKSGDVMGALASWMLIAIGLGFTPTIVLLPVLQPAWQLLTSLFQAGLFGSAFLFLCLFPNGRFYPYWSRYAVTGWLVYVLLWLPLPQLNLHRASDIWPSFVFAIVIWLGVVAQLLRYRRVSGPDEKQQTKWVIAGFAVGNFGLLGIAFLLGSGAIHSAALLVGAILLLSLVPIFIPLTIGVALLRYRLWQIDIILNRSLVYIGLSLGIIAIYALTVGGLSLLFQSQNSLLISLLATGFIAVFFQPVRDRLQRGVNRLMFGERDDPAAVLAQLGQRLEAISQPEAVLPAIVETITQALKLPYAAIVLADETVAAATGTQTNGLLQTFPLVYQSEMVGQLQVVARAPGEGLSAADEQILRQVALQAGTAVHAIRLTHDLQQSRIHIVTTREEERRRLRRDLHDELGPLIASQGLKLAAVRELLTSDPATAVKILDDVLTKNQNTIADVRRLVYNLRPPTLDELGLVGAIREYVQNSEQSGLHVTITASPAGLPPLSAAVEAAAYRIVLEAFTNVVRHAEARRCEISLGLETEDWRLEIGDYPVSSSQSLILQIQDDGVGLNENGRRGVGLSSMRERAEEVGGLCEVVSEGRGVRVTAVLPLGV